MVENKFYIYQHVDPITHCVRYVGKGHGKRAWTKSHRNPYHTNVIKQLTTAGLTPTVYIVEAFLTEEQAFEAEMQWIERCRTAGEPLTNLTNGGEGVSGWIPTEETRRKMSEAKFGKTRSAETRRKMSEAKFGKTRSAETRRKISDANFGKTRSAETRRKMSEAKFGKTRSAETRRKISDATRGEKNHNFGKPALNRRTVTGVNLMTGEERTFVSTYDAAAFIGGVHQNVSRCCCGKLKTHKGWKFTYAPKGGAGAK